MAALVCGGSVLACGFALVEWKYVNLPMLPARLFKYGYSTNILISANLAIGWIYWSNLFILPLYFQTIRGMGAGESGLWILPITISHGLTSATTGIIISMCKCYKPVILTGAICWTVAALVKLQYSEQTSTRTIFLMGILDGVGVGCSMQPGRPTYLGHSPQILLLSPLIVQLFISPRRPFFTVEQRGSCCHDRASQFFTRPRCWIRNSWYDFILQLRPRDVG